MYFQYMYNMSATCTYIYIKNVPGIFSPSRQEVSSTLLLYLLFQNSWRFYLHSNTFYSKRVVKTINVSKYLSNQRIKKESMFLSNRNFVTGEKTLASIFAVPLLIGRHQCYVPAHHDVDVQKDLS